MFRGEQTIIFFSNSCAHKLHLISSKSLPNPIIPNHIGFIEAAFEHIKPISKINALSCLFDLAKRDFCQVFGSSV